MNILSEEEKINLRIQHKKERDKRICDRIKAVLLYDKGWSVQAIAEALLLSDDAICSHISEYTTLKKLKPENGGSTEKLFENQSKELEKHLQNHTYLYVKDIILWIKLKWGISYTVPGMTNWLKRHGFSYKKPALIPGKANEKQQKKWLEEYQNLKQNLSQAETICFIDGIHPTHNVQKAYGWIKKGERKEIPANTGRARINLSGSVDIISHKLIVQEDKNLNSKSTICFFRKIT